MKQRKRKEQITKAVTHIRLSETNAGKLAALDELAGVYLSLCQQYVTLFCTGEQPDPFRATCFAVVLSERWQRVAIQQAAGVAQSWRTNRENAYQSYLQAQAANQRRQVDGTRNTKAKEPQWREWDVPVLRQVCIQANANVVALEVAADSTFDYWLKVGTLQKGQPIRVPVKLAPYHKEQLTDPKSGKRKPLNRSVTLNKREGG